MHKYFGLLVLALAACGQPPPGGAADGGPAPTGDAHLPDGAAVTGDAGLEASDGGGRPDAGSSRPDAGPSTAADSGSAGPDAASSASDAGAPDTGPAPGSSFAAQATNWPVPQRAANPTGFNRYATATWTTLDLTGDGKPDLVWCADDSGVVWPSPPHWKVFVNEGNGFALQPVNWPVPGNVHSPASSTWGLRDLTGDGKPDLVLFAQCCSSDKDWNPWNWDLADPYWKVYVNTGSGFEATPLTWKVPIVSNLTPSAKELGLNALENGNHWTTQDLDGDALPDLVLFADASHRAFGSGSARYWKAYLGTGTSFSAQSVQWTVPPHPTSTAGFNLWSGTKWSTVDLTADGKPDLVWTADDAGLTWAGPSPYWKVFSNDGTGFAASPLQWSVPDSRLNSTTSSYWALRDLSGDGKLDLVWFAQRGTQDTSWLPWNWNLADPYWKVFGNLGASFATQQITWKVPVVYNYSSTGADLGPNALDSSLSWTTQDLDGDGRLDFVEFSRGGGSVRCSTATSCFWKVYFNQ